MKAWTIIKNILLILAALVVGTAIGTTIGLGLTWEVKTIWNFFNAG